MKIISTSKTFNLILAIWFIVGIASIPICQSSWEKDLSELITEDNEVKSGKLLDKIVAAGADWKEISAELGNITFPMVSETGNFKEYMIACEDDIDRPYIVYTPPKYNSSVSTPLLVYLHGGVSRKEIVEERMDYAKENHFIQLAEKRNWLVVFPFGQLKATWWDDVGIKNVLKTIRTVKRNYNVDDDRVWMTGFSDGASASFLFSMTYPSDFGAFIPLNGHMGVGSLDGELPLYASNMRNSPIYAINTDIDPLYPGDRMRPMIDMARSTGSDIIYREYHGIGHDFDYWQDERDRIGRFLDRHPRDPLPHSLTWKTAQSQFGAECHWFRIDKITPTDAANWHEDANLSLVNHRISIGFFPDQEFKDNGVKIKNLVDGESLAKQIGLEPNDIIIKCNDSKIKSLDDLDTFKSTLNRGDQIIVIVNRKDEKITIKGNIPEAASYFLFPRKQPSAAAKVDFRSNTVSISGSRLGGFTVFIHPDMFQLDQKVIINLNGKTVFNNIVHSNIRFMINNFLENRDKQRLYINKIEIRTSL